jgi:predicted ABC-type sugar transport system permease subunit
MANEKTAKRSFMDNAFGKFIMNNKALLILILLGAVVACISDVFFTASNLLNVVRQVAYSVTLA